MTSADSLDKRVQWGELLAHDEDTFVARGRLDDRAVVIKRFRLPEYRREIETYQVLKSLGVPTLDLVDSGTDWLAIEDVTDHAIWRLATPEDAENPVVARHLADWYARLHLAGTASAQVVDYDESEAVTDEALAAVAARWPDMAEGIAVARQWLPGWRAAIDALPKTLTYNDFAWDNVVVARDLSSAMMLDYNLLGRGYRYADVRNVLSQMGSTAPIFWDDYVALAGPIPADEIDADERLAPLVALVFAEMRGGDILPRWAEDAAAYVRALAS